MDKQPNGLWTKVIAGVIVGALALALTPDARAQGTPAKPDLAAAKKHYGEGDKKYKAGDFAGALTEFKAANDIKSTPQAERYIGMTEDNLGHYAAAADWYDKFLAHVPDKLASEGDEIKKRDAEIKALPGKVHIESTPPGANVTIDEKPQASPAPLDVDLPPGPHTVKLTEQGRLPAQKQIDVGYASAQAVTVTLDSAPPPPVAPPAPPTPVAVAPPPAPAPPPSEPRSQVPAYITGALAIAAAGVGTVFGVLALNDKSSFDKTPTTQIADNGDTHSLISDMSFGVAITFGVTSAVLFLTRDEAPAAAASASKDTPAKAASSKHRAVTITPTPMVGAHSGGAGFVLQF
ncbi:MAG: PEGA domain-containing protein [Polyangiaceae bacterium]